MYDHPQSDPEFIRFLDMPHAVAMLQKIDEETKWRLLRTVGKA